MVANHSLKQQARQLQRRFGGLYSYIEALEIVKERNLQRKAIRDEAVATGFYNSPERKPLNDKVSAAMQNGRDLIIFGGPASGKSSALHSFLHLPNIPKPIFLEEDSRGEFAWIAKEESVPYAFRTAKDGAIEGLDDEIGLIALDEVYGHLTLPRSRQWAFTIHGHSVENVLSRLKSLTKDMTPRDPLMINSVYEPQTRKRHLELCRD